MTSRVIVVATGKTGPSGVGGELRLAFSATDGAANTTVLNAALANLYASNGGTLVFPAGDIPISGQIVLPNDGGGIFSTDAQLQPTYVWRGQGAFTSGQAQATVATGTRAPGGTRLILTYANASYNMAKIVTRGLGLFSIEHITFCDTTPNASTPILYSTNTTLKINNCCFMGATVGTSCQLDAIVLGGTLKPISSGYDDANSAFQGYGTVIRDNYFDRIRRAVYGRSYCNQVVIDSNFMEKDCGSNLTGGACIEFDGSLVGADEGDYCTSNRILNNYLNGLYYVYQVKLKKCSRSVVAFNYAPDPSATLLALVRIEGVNQGGPDYASADNIVLSNFCQDQSANHISSDVMSAKQNTLIDGGTSDGSIFRQLGMSGSRFTIPTPTAIQDWQITDGVVNWFRLNGVIGNAALAAPLTLVGNVANAGSAAGTTALTIGNNSAAADAALVINPPTGQVGQIQFRRAGTNSWLFYDANSNVFYFRDSVNGLMTMTFNPGTVSTGNVELGVKLRALATQGIEMGSGGPFWRAGADTPEGAVTAPVGSLWTRTNGGASTTLYVKESGTGNTGWIAK